MIYIAQLGRFCEKSVENTNHIVGNKPEAIVESNVIWVTCRYALPVIFASSQCQTAKSVSHIRSCMFWKFLVTLKRHILAFYMDTWGFMADFTHYCIGQYENWSNRISTC